MMSWRARTYCTWSPDQWTFWRWPSLGWFFVLYCTVLAVPFPSHWSVEKVSKDTVLPHLCFTGFSAANTHGYSTESDSVLQLYRTVAVPFPRHWSCEKRRASIQSFPTFLLPTRVATYSTVSDSVLESRWRECGIPHQHPSIKTDWLFSCVKNFWLMMLFCMAL